MRTPAALHTPGWSALAAFPQFLVDGSPVSDRDDTDHAVHGLIDDAESAHAVLPVAHELPPERLSRSPVTRQKTERLLDSLLHVRRKGANDVGNVGRDVVPADDAHRRRFRATWSGSPKTSSNENPRFLDA